MSPSARYWVAQYVRDVFKNEAKNVGVFVELDGAVECRFLGETDGEIDGRKLKLFSYPDVYRQWVAYWRAEVNRDLRGVIEAPASNYRVVEGGEVDGLLPEERGAESMREVTNYLYSALVSEGGFAEALGAGPEAEQQVLAGEVLDALKQADVLEASWQVLPHPVRRGAPVKGNLGVEHRPAFSQENGRLYVMETVDFTLPRRQPSRDHAGWSAYMFSDIRNLRQDAQGIAVVRVTEQDEHESEEVRSSLAILRNEGDVVNWLREPERARFLAERKEVAQAR